MHFPATYWQKIWWTQEKQRPFFILYLNVLTKKFRMFMTLSCRVCWCHNSILTFAIAQVFFVRQFLWWEDIWDNWEDFFSRKLGPRMIQKMLCLWQRKRPLFIWYLNELAKKLRMFMTLSCRVSWCHNSMLAFTMPCSSEQIVIDGVDMVGMQTSHWYWEPRIVGY